MRQPLSSRRSYRDVLIAAGLTAALGVGTACAESGAAAAQPHADGQSPNGAAALQPPRAGDMARTSRR
jgi:hypothetical protein